MISTITYTDEDIEDFARNLNHAYETGQRVPVVEEHDTSANLARVQSDWPAVLAHLDAILAATPDGDDRRRDLCARASTLVASSWPLRSRMRPRVAGNSSVRE